MIGARLRHILLVAGGYTLFFLWMYGRPLLRGGYLVEADLYEQYLPMFLAPLTRWSPYEFSGFPVFADAQDIVAYVPHVLFDYVFRSWTALAVSAHVLGACFTYAYVFHLTGSRPASAFAGLAYALSEAMVERIAHLTIFHAIAWLPLIALSIDRIRGMARARWVVLGACALAQCLLAGHPQIALYTYYVCGVYALVGGWAERADRRYYATIGVMFVLGGLLTAVKAIPVLEASLYTGRQETSFSQFTGHANSPAQMLSALFPTILHEGREAPTYVGLATLVFAVMASFQARRNWRVAFWLVVAVCGFLLGAGSNTPLAHVAYYLPGYDKFRVGARHLFLAAFGAAVLAGIGLAAIQRQQLPRRSAALSVALLIGTMAAGAAVMALFPEAFQFENRRPLLWMMPLWTSGVWEQFAIALVTAGLALGIARMRRLRAAGAVLIAVLLIDDLHAIPYRVTPIGITSDTAAPDAIEQPSVHAVRLATEMKPQDQRLLALSGTAVDAVVPAAFARVWRIPIAGGYNPMVLGDYAALADMNSNGGIGPSTLSGSDVALDLLAVKYLLVRPRDTPDLDTFEEDRIVWGTKPFELSIGRADCGHRYPRSVSIPLPKDIEISALGLVTFLRCSEDVPAGSEVASVRLVASNGEHVARLRAGHETAETGLFDPTLRARARHRPADVFGTPPAGSRLTYFTRVDLPSPLRGGRLEFHAPGTGGWAVIDRLTLLDPRGRSHPVASPHIWLKDDERWKEVRRFSTSRWTDRGVDEAAPGEDTVTLFENTRARPRSWIVQEIVSVTDGDAVEAVRRSQLPDGRRFDPVRTALVQAGELSSMTFQPGPAFSHVETITDSRIRVTAATAEGGFLVLSDTFYPGWRARIDGRITPVHRTNVALRGVVLPAGRHTVEFEFQPRSLLIGMVTSVAAVIACIMLLAADFSPKVKVKSGSRLQAMGSRHRTSEARSQTAGAVPPSKIMGSGSTGCGRHAPANSRVQEIRHRT